MIEENAQVISINDNDVVIEPVKASGCAGCGQGGSCGVSLLAGLFGRRRTRYHAVNTSAVSLQPGDRIVIGIDEHAIVSGSLIVYALPLVLLVMAALAGGILADSFAENYREIIAIAAAACGFAAGLRITRYFSRRADSDSRYQPVILRRDHA